MRAVSDDVAGQGGEPRERGHLHGVEQQGRYHGDDHAPHPRPAARTLRRAAEDRQSAGQVEAPGSGAEETHLRPAHHAELNYFCDKTRYYSRLNHVPYYHTYNPSHYHHHTIIPKPTLHNNIAMSHVDTKYSEIKLEKNNQ